MQAAEQSLRQNIVPDAPCTMGAVAVLEIAVDHAKKDLFMTDRRWGCGSARHGSPNERHLASHSHTTGQMFRYPLAK
jgi:hypothetical protein